MRKWALRLLPVALTGLLFGGYIFWPKSNGPIGRGAYDRLTNGMTEAEVEAVIGLPAGDYSSEPVIDTDGELFYIEYVKGFQPAVTKRWVSDYVLLAVDFDSDGQLRG